MACVEGVLLDASVLLPPVDDDKIENVALSPSAEYLLRKLRYSNMRIGISYGLSLPDHKVSILQSHAKSYSFDCYLVNPSSLDDTVNEIALTWSVNKGRFLYVVSNCNEGLASKLSVVGWLITILRSPGQGLSYDNACDDASMLYVNKLEELPSRVCRLNSEAIGKDRVTVGYIMKPSREEDFAKRGALPMYPTPNGLIFMPITYELPLSSQLQEIDIILHKATDEIVSIEASTSSKFFDNITYTRGMQELKMYIEQRPTLCIVDPLSNIFPLLDRFKTQQILLGLESLNKEGRPRIRGPNFLKVDNFDELDLEERLLEANLTPPSIVKPQVACGVADAHSMAIVFRTQDYSGLNVPLPAVVQEYVDHSCTLFKFYVLGEKVYHAVKKSTPNADSLIKLSENNGLKPMLFDSLKSLPVSNQNQQLVEGTEQQIDLELVSDAASWLRNMLDLTIFGFDVVVQDGCGDHVIVDVNYLPSFKEIPDDVAIPAFWEAIKSKYASRKS